MGSDKSRSMHLAASGIQVVDLAHNTAFYSVLKHFARNKKVEFNEQVIRRDPGMSLPASSEAPQQRTLRYSKIRRPGIPR